MTDQIKKQTNLGIALAIIGFTMVGGALVLVPSLVDRKVESLRLAVKDAGAESPAKTPGISPQKKAAGVANSKGAGASLEKASVDMASTKMNGKASGEENKALGESAESGASGSATAKTGDAATTKSFVEPANDDSSWELVLTKKFEPDAASQPKLQTVIDMMKSHPGMRIRVLGMNNINKMSKLAQIGANRIAAQIVKDAEVVRERVEVSVEQQTGMTDVRVRITILGGAQ